MARYAELSTWQLTQDVDGEWVLWKFVNKFYTHKSKLINILYGVTSSDVVVDVNRHGTENGI